MKKFALNLQLQTIQIFTNDVQNSDAHYESFRIQHCAQSR